MTIEVVRRVEKSPGPSAQPRHEAARDRRSPTAELLISLLASSLLHALLLVALALLFTVLPGKGKGSSLWLSTKSQEEDLKLEQLDSPQLEMALPENRRGAERPAA